MKVSRQTEGEFVIEFESEEELRREFAANISAGGLFIQSGEKPAEMSQLRLRLKFAGETTTTATVVRLFDAAFAVSIEGNPDELLSQLLTKPKEDDAKNVNVWDRIRSLTHAEKIILAAKADRQERAVLAQDNDSQILYYLLKNPRITAEEVLRIARLTSISAQVADLIARTTQWSSNQEIRAALVNNPRTPTPLALKLLPTLPEPEIRQIAKSTAVSQALKQAALRIVISRG
ncbi:MAG: hypothetical protein AB1631_12305 [Acidobacteriota bacterium]